MSDGRKTCQICARAIKANTGVIAHHGYQRPHGWGHQTASCPGSRELPFEESCAALRGYIEHTLRPAKAQAEATVERWNSNPPKEILVPATRYNESRPVTENDDDYERLLFVRQREAAAELTAITRQLERQLERISNWRAQPETEAA
ncbi:MAG: hypothetical protein AAFR65_10445 [Pseudomonadota bacterium]